MRQEEFFFLELLQVALGSLNELSVVPSTSDWNAIYRIAEAQNLFFAF